MDIKLSSIVLSLKITDNTRTIQSRKQNELKLLPSPHRRMHNVERLQILLVVVGKLHIDVLDVPIAYVVLSTLIT